MIKRVMRYFGFVPAADVMRELDDLRAKVEMLSASIVGLQDRERSVIGHIISLFKHVIVGKKDIEHVLQGSQINTELINSLNAAMNEMAGGMQGLYDMLTQPRPAIDQAIALPEINTVKKKGSVN